MAAHECLYGVYFLFIFMTGMKQILKNIEDGKRHQDSVFEQ